MLKKIILYVLVILCLLIQPISVYGESVSARSAIVMDADTNEILYSKNINEELAIASITKIMTALIALESGKLNCTVTVTFDMVNTIGNTIGIKENDTITLYDLVVAMMLASGNDAANSVAIFLSGSIKEFASVMNERAAEIGMKNSLFVTPSGLDEGNHHSSAYDMALLTSVAIKNEKFVEICSMKSSNVVISGKVHTFYNHNKLLSMIDDCIGVKTGYTEKCGRSLVSAVKRKGKTMICVTINDGDDWNDHINLYKSCIKKYEKSKINNCIDIKIVGGVSETVSCSYSSTVLTLDSSKTSCKEYYFKINYAPVKKGDIMGFSEIYYNNKLVDTVPIKAKESVNYLR